MSNHRLSESNKSFVNQLSTISIPNSVQEALADPMWKAAMNEEMKLVSYHTIRKFRLSIMIIISLRRMNLDNLN